MMKFVGQILLLIILSGCTSPVTPTEEEINNKIQEEVNNKIEQAIILKRVDCIRTILSMAENEVDSILFSEIDLDLLDSTAMIDKPNAPERPDYIRDIDTSQIIPLFDSINQ